MLNEIQTIGIIMILTMLIVILSFFTHYTNLFIFSLGMLCGLLIYEIALLLLIKS